jgi:cytoskeletal protein CcmA (bactofilin family)
VGDIHHQTLTIEKGAYFEGRSVQAHGSNGQQPDRADKKLAREVANNSKAA